MESLSSNKLVEDTLVSLNKALGTVMHSEVIHFDCPIIIGIDDAVRHVIEGLAETAEGDQNSRISVVLQTPGGSIEVTERIYKTLRKHYDHVDFIIPNYAYSAGTLLALSGDEIYMDYYSVLGPIDPQYQGDDGKLLPGMGYLAKFEELTAQINDATEKGITASAELAYLLNRFNPAELFHIEQGIEHGKALLKEWLPRHKFKNWHQRETTGEPVTDELKQERAGQIADLLGNVDRWHSHGRGISIAELDNEEMKLKINDFGEDEEKNPAIRNYYQLFNDYSQRLGIKAALHSRDGLRRI